MTTMITLTIAVLAIIFSNVYSASLSVEKQREMFESYPIDKFKECANKTNVEFRKYTVSKEDILKGNVTKDMKCYRACIAELFGRINNEGKWVGSLERYTYARTSNDTDVIENLQNIEKECKEKETVPGDKCESVFNVELCVMNKTKGQKGVFRAFDMD